MLRTNISIVLIIVLLLGLNVDVYADRSINQQTTINQQAIIDKIEEAYAQADVTTLEELVRTTEGYGGNLAGYRLSTILNFQNNKNAADEKIQQVVKHLREHLKTHPDDAESWALLSSSYGLMVAYNPARGMTHGPMANQTLSKAYALDSHNPRVKLLDGIAKYHTPEMFGGSKTEAVKILTEAIMDYPNDINSGFHWGWADAYIWRGMARLDLGNKPNAVSDWQKALEISPDSQRAKQLLEKHR